MRVCSACQPVIDSESEAVRHGPLCNKYICWRPVKAPKLRVQTPSILINRTRFENRDPQASGPKSCRLRLHVVGHEQGRSRGVVRCQRPRGPCRTATLEWSDEGLELLYAGRPRTRYQ